MLAVHGAGRVPVEADVGSSRVGVAPGTLQRLVQDDPLPTRRQKQRVDGLHGEAHAEGDDIFELGVTQSIMPQVGRIWPCFQENDRGSLVLVSKSQDAKVIETRSYSDEWARAIK